MTTTFPTRRASRVSATYGHSPHKPPQPRRGPLFITPHSERVQQKDHDMGNASSQLLNPADDRVNGHSDSTDSDRPDSYGLGTDRLESDSPDSPDSDGPDVGLPMSPYMSRAFGSPMSPLPGDEDDNGGGYTLNETSLPSPPAKKKQKKRRKKVVRATPKDDQQNDTGWLHKREEDELDGAALVPETPDDEPLPDLLPSQVKSEHQSDTDSDSDAPSGERLADESVSKRFLAPTKRSRLLRPNTKPLAENALKRFAAISITARIGRKLFARARRGRDELEDLDALQWPSVHGF